MKSAAMRQADIILSKCGRTLPPGDGMASLDLYRGIFYQSVVATASTQQQPLEITGDTSFFLSAISGLQPPAGLDVYLQILFPNGRTLQQSYRDWTQDAAFGSGRYILDSEVECPPGSKIRIGSSTVFANPQTTCAFSILFEGVERYWLERSSGRRIPYSELASSMPRVFKTRIQNLTAPRWMTGGFPAPEGMQKYLYASANVGFPLPAAASGQNPFLEIPVDAGFEFFVGRVFVRYSFDEGSSGVVYIRRRQSDGYMLDEDYVALDGVNGQFLPAWWRIPPGKSVVVDLAIMDAVGSGNLNLQMWLEGGRRRAKG